MMQILNLNKDKIDITKIKNAKFLYKPDTKELILESGDFGNINLNDYIRGFISFDNHYKNGIIHFSPEIRKENIEKINAGLLLIEQLIKLGANDKIKLRNFGFLGEMKYSDLISKKVLSENYQDKRSTKEQFAGWFYGSKVVDKNNQPLPVYKLEENKYTSNEWVARIKTKQKLLKSFLRIENPYIVNGKLTETYDSLKKKGYDGIMKNDTYIIFENNQVKGLEEATAQKDNEFRNAVEDIFDEIQYNIRNGKYGVVKTTPAGFGVAILISKDIKKYMPDFKDKKIYLLLLELDKQKLGFYSNISDGLGGIYMYILPDDVMNKLATYHTNNDIKNLSKVLKSDVWSYFMHHKDTFIHELTHALDFTRLKNYKSRKVSQLNMSDEDYLSDPLEFNAWFTAKISQYNDILQMLPEFKNSWKAFYSYILDEMDFIKKYNTKYRRKFDKRLYQYWKENINKSVKEGYIQRKSEFGNTGVMFDNDYIDFEVGMSYIDENNIKWTIVAVGKDRDGDQICRVESENGQTDIITADILNIDLFDLDKKHMVYDERFFKPEDIQRTSENLNEEKFIAYHGGQKGIKSFKVNKTEYGMLFFTNSEDLAKSYIGYNDSDLSNQELYTVELNINNPLDLRTKEALPIIAKAIHQSENLQKEWLEKEEEYWDNYIKKENDVVWYLGQRAIQFRDELKKYAISNGYDAILDYEPTPDGRFNENWQGYLVFNDKQVKILKKEKITETLSLNNIQTLNEEVYTVYHGSPNTFDTFSYDFVGKGNDERGPGFYFTSKKEDALMYGKVGEYQITLDKLVSTKQKASIEVIEKIIALFENCQTIDEMVEKYENDEDLWWDSPLSNYAEHPYTAIQVAIDLARQKQNEYKTFLDLWAGVYNYDNKKFLQAVSSLGYDGVIFKVANETTHYIVFNPSKIKKVKEIVTEGKVVSTDFGKIIINPNYEQCVSLIDRYDIDLRGFYDPQVNIMLLASANSAIHWHLFLYLWKNGYYPDFGKPVENINDAPDAVQDYYDYKTSQFVISIDYNQDYLAGAMDGDLNAFDNYIIGNDFITYYKTYNSKPLEQTRLWKNIIDNSMRPELGYAAESVNLLETTYNQVLDNPFGYLPKDEESVKKVKKFIQLYGDKYQNNQIKFYHATNADYDIENQGLLPTSKNRRNSYQSGSGYVYLANTPEQAKEFADLAFPRNNIAIYEVDVYFNQMLPDKDQIRNQRMYAGKEELKDTLANSIVFGGGIRVKGKIPSYQIHLLKVIERKSVEKLID